MDIAGWLRSLGLEQYEQVFRDNRIEADVLRSLTVEDLKDLGVALVGDRRRLLDAIAALGTTAPAAASVDAPTSASAERRQLTVMFCDLVGSTALSAQLDPEDLREVIGAYHRAVADVVRGFDGFVAKYMGDGVLVYFGYPRAHEDDAERAVRAGLDLIDAVGRLDVKSAALQTRVGIATGLVVVGDLIGQGSAQERSVVGETPNLAARLQSLAEPGAVVIAASTRRLIGDLFEYRDLGAVEVKGISAPVHAWQVLRTSGVESRFEALRGLALTPLVGRDEEIDLLLRRWTRAETGDGQVVLISGEPGIGKSRVAAAFEERLQAQSHLRLRYFCSPYHQDSALHPFIDQLGRAAGFARDDSPAAKLEKLEAVLALAAPPEEDVTLLADLLSLPVSERHPLPNLSPQRKKERALEALLQQLDGLARQHPILMVFEDAHWVDPTSRELLDLTVERVGNLPILMIVTFRPEFQPSWTGQPQVTMLPLDRLDRRERIALVEQIAGGKALSDEVIAQIADRTDGVPLFVEEFTKSVLESGAPLVGIPTTLHDSLMARLDRWASVRRVAQIGAAIGREFPYALLRAVSRLPEDELRAALARLVESELVFQRGAPPDAVYAFKHALIQDAAHSSLLRSARQQLHAKIAETLEAQSPELMDTEPELFAQHYSEALLVEKAVGYWRRAGQRSIAKSTFVEAIAQLNRGLLLLATLPESRDRNQRELDLQVTLAFALRGMTGYGHSDVAKALRRAHTLVVDIEAVDSILHFSVVYGLTAVNLTGGKPRAALDQAQEFLRLAQCQSDPGLLAVGHTLVGHVLIAIGNYPTALSHLERAAALYSPAKRQTDALRFGTETGVQAFSTSACALWHCGYPDQAKHAADEGLRQARQSTHLISLAFAIFHICLAPTCAPPETAVETLVQELVAISSQNKYSVFLGWGLILQGWAIARRGQPGAGVERIREGLAMSQAVGSHLYEPIFLGLFADALAMTGETAKGLAVVAEALTISEAWGARGNDAELHRLQGKFLLRLPSSNWAEVETCYRRALAIARQQGTRGLELRAAISLARLLTDQERHDEARDLLAPVYGWFSEGFGTPDLKAARALLDELGGA